MPATVQHFHNSSNGRWAVIKHWPDGPALLSLYGCGRMLRSTVQPSLAQAREIALNWTRGLYSKFDEVA